MTRAHNLTAAEVRAVLGGSKTQFRKVIKLCGQRPDFCGPSGSLDDPTCWGWQDSEHGDWVTIEKDRGQRMGWRDWIGAPHVGDQLWVREAWGINHYEYERAALANLRRRPPNCDDEYLSYRATESDCEIANELCYRSSMHMPRWASRLTLTVTDVRVQRLQDISEDDAIAEGVNAIHHGDGAFYYSMARDLPDPKNWCHSDDAFREFWNANHKPGEQWSDNPWVCAVTFDYEQRNIDSATVING